uniref:DASH family cryptochrome n=1 Tax=Thaumasiovibrio occultus TaxID=1891184 RepID=UPI000B362D0A|nr:DASH family cryptochrome [Thaumasiovibrio occultus]
MTTALYWFGDDLRIDDNPLLQQAARQADRLLCIYCVEPFQLKTNRYTTGSGMSALRWQFLVESLHDLTDDLNQVGQVLLVEIGSALDVIPTLIVRYGVTDVFRSQSAGYWEQQQADVLAARFPAVQFHDGNNRTLFSAQQAQQDTLPDTFSKFRRRAERWALRPSAEIAAWPKCAVHRQPALPLKSPSSLSYAKGGSVAGKAHLKRYFRTAAAHTYKETRNALDGAFTSTGFSPWLASGSLSPIQVMEALARYESERGANESTDWIRFELLWREYFHWYASHWREKLFALNGVGSGSAKGSHYGYRFKAWCEGMTPYPLVNALMNQLKTTGFMSNRGRQIVASCLVHELALDWRLGAAYFEQQLLDYDVGSNWGNWQYIAGVGCDPRGGRHFNIAKQTELFDPKGLFIKQWHGDKTMLPLDAVDAADWPLY